MSVLERLITTIGSQSRRLAGTKVVYLQERESPIRSDATGSARAVLLGRFLQLDYGWAYEGATQEGSLLVGVDPEGQATAAWADTWHMGRAIMHLAGTGGDKSIDLHGTFGDPSADLWGWRILLSVPTMAGIDVRMFIIPPGEVEAPAVELLLR